MSVEIAERLRTLLSESTGDLLRSVAYYDDEGYEVVYLRDDVADEYDEDEIDEAFEDVRLEALTKPRQEDLYTHGRLECVVRCFSEAVEMHFDLTETTGVAAALDREVMESGSQFLGECLALTTGS